MTSRYHKVTAALSEFERATSAALIPFKAKVRARAEAKFGADTLDTCAAASFLRLLNQCDTVVQDPWESAMPSFSGHNVGIDIVEGLYPDTAGFEVRCFRNNGKDVEAKAGFEALYGASSQEAGDFLKDFETSG